MQQKKNLEKSNKTKRQRIRVGNVYEIGLPNGKKAYGRLFEDGTLGIYDKICDDVSELPEDENYKFFVGVYRDLLTDGEWPVVAYRKFASEEEAWPPPRCVVDAITYVGSIYYKGEIHPCSYEECKDLEIVAAWDRHHLVDRLMGDDVWEKGLNKPVDPNKKNTSDK